MSPLVPVVVLAGLGYGAYRLVKKGEKQKVTKRKVESALDLGLCGDPEELGAFNKTQGWTIWLVEDKPVSEWRPARVEFTSDPQAIAYSRKDCGFYSWDGSAWIENAAADAELRKWQEAQP